MASFIEIHQQVTELWENPITSRSPLVCYPRKIKILLLLLVIVVVVVVVVVLTNYGVIHL